MIKARVFGKKESGGKVELLLNRPLKEGYSVFIRGKVQVGSKLFFDQGLVAEVISLITDGSREVVFFKEGNRLDFSQLIAVLDEIGHMPLPPYIDREDDKSDTLEYQTVFAKNEGAVAAPTASLHFSDEMMQEIKKKSFLTLHVGAGTFKPVDAENLFDHPMHSEYYDIPSKAMQILESREDITAVGTTSTRTIEYFARTKKAQGECDLFLHVENRPIRVNHLLTNFHLPKSTLIMLVSAFIGREKTLSLYQEAIEREYRFYSYGDAMLIL